MAPGDDTDSGMESQEGSLRESQDNVSAKEETDEPTATDEPIATEEPTEDAEESTELPAEQPEIAAETEEYTPETKPAIEDAYSDEPDESVVERLWGLTEMFPESVRNVTYTVTTTTASSIKTFYGFSRSAFWIIFSSSIILFAPVIFEVERVQMEEAQRTQQKQMLLGPNTAVSGGGMPLMPPMHR